MDKKVLIAVIGILAGLSIAVIIISSGNKEISPSISPSPASSISPTASLSAGLKLYTDPSGFSFQYPENFTVSPQKLTSEQTYAHVEITDPKKTSTASIKIETSDLKTVDDWFTPKKKAGIFGQIKSIKLADLSARQFITNNQKTTIALDIGVLITITQDAKASSSPYDQIVKTFAFVPPQDTSLDETAASISEDVIFEGEEVVE